MSRILRWLGHPRAPRFVVASTASRCTMASARPDGGRNDSLSAVDVNYTKLLSTIAALEVTGNETLYALDAELSIR